MNTLLLSFCFNCEVHRLKFSVLQGCGRDVKTSLNMMVKENGMLIVSKCWLAYQNLLLISNWGSHVNSDGKWLTRHQFWWSCSNFCHDFPQTSFCGLLFPSDSQLANSLTRLCLFQLELGERTGEFCYSVTSLLTSDTCSQMK